MYTTGKHLIKILEVMKMEYVSVIVDECGDVVAYCRDLSEIKISKIMEEHPEWRLTCVCL